MKSETMKNAAHLAALIGLALIYGAAGFCVVYASSKNVWAAAAAGLTAMAGFFDPKSGQGSKAELARTIVQQVNGDQTPAGDAAS